MQNWIYIKNYERLQATKKNKWEIDEAIFINPKKDKAILLLLEQDTAKYTTEPVGDGSPEKIIPTFLDYVHLIYANKEKDGWHFYYQSMPSMVVPREKKVNGIPIPLTFEELSLTGVRNILLSYYKKGTCKYNNKFFDRWDINNLKEKHKKINGYY